MSNQHSTQITPEVWTSEVVRYTASDDCGGVRCTYVRSDRNNVARLAAKVTGEARGAEQDLRVYMPTIKNKRYKLKDITHTLPDHIKTHDEAVTWWIKRLTGGGQ